MPRSPSPTIRRLGLAGVLGALLFVPGQRAQGVEAKPVGVTTKLPHDIYSEIWSNIDWAYRGGNGPCTQEGPCRTWVWWTNVQGVRIPITRAFGFGAQDMIIAAKAAAMVGEYDMALGLAVGTQLHNRGVQDLYDRHWEVLMQVLIDYPISINGRWAACTHLMNTFPVLRPVQHLFCR